MHFLSQLLGSAIIGKKIAMDMYFFFFFFKGRVNGMTVFW